MRHQALIISSALLAILALSADAPAQSPPGSQCVTSAVAGGTGDAITIPTLPCVPTTTLLVLTTKFPSTTTSPTLSYPGLITPMPIKRFDGSSPAAGEIVANARYMLTSNGTNWYMLQQSAAGSTSNNCPNIIGYGGAGDGTTDNSPALLAAVAAQPGTPCVSFSAGKFKFASAVPVNLSGPYAAFSLVGAGAGVTEIIAPAGSSWLTLTESGQFNSFNFRDFSFETPSPCATCTGLTVIQQVATTSEGYTPTSTFTNVNFFGTDRAAAGGTNYWGTGILLQGVSNVNFEGVFGQALASNITLGKRGIDIETASLNTPVIFNLHSVTLNNYSSGLYLNTKVQGVTVDQSNFTNNQTCINVPGGAGPGSQLTVANSAMACATGVLVGAPWGGINLSNNLLELGTGGNNGVSGVQDIGFILTVSAQYATITGNVITGNGATTNVGVAVATAVNSGLVMANTFAGVNIGVVLNPGATGWVINPNQYLNTPFTVVNNSTSGPVPPAAAAPHNVVNNFVVGAQPTLTSGCGTGALLTAESTDESGLIDIGTSPSTGCTITFSQPFQVTPRCFASNTSSLARQVQPLFMSKTGMQLAANTTLASTDLLTYHCDGYQ